ncbi:hypothetical protein [Actinoplanes awajinensis]|nr:hypothetical protein [Actinoplanes awajinensis]
MESTYEQDTAEETEAPAPAPVPALIFLDSADDAAVCDVDGTCD